MRAPSFFLVACLVAACNSTKDHPKRSQKDQAKYAAAVERKEVLLGMKKSEVREAVGMPQRTKRTVYKSRRVTAWSYAFSEIYFDDDGFVVGWIAAG